MGARRVTTVRVPGFSSWCRYRRVGPIIMKVIGHVIVCQLTRVLDGETQDEEQDSDPHED